jgi:hypothetical protein
MDLKIIKCDLFRPETVRSMQTPVQLHTVFKHWDKVTVIRSDRMKRFFPFGMLREFPLHMTWNEENAFRHRKDKDKYVTL